jgi:hypothetical protein
MYQPIKHQPDQGPWNKGKLVGQNLPLQLQEIWIDDALELAEETEV